VTWEPGVYEDISDTDYHGDKDSLSSSGAKALLPPSCPAIFKQWRDHGRPPKKEYDFGHAAHRYVLGKGSEIVLVDADSWRTNKAKDAKDAAYAEG
jgi:hypothetical protein